MNLTELYRDDLLNRFVSHTFTETAVDDHTKVEFKDSGNVLVGDAKKLIVADAYRNIREKLIGRVSEIMFFITTTQRDAISSPETGFQIHNITTDQINVFNGTIWVIIGNGAGVFGTEFEKFESLTQSSTTSGTFQSKIDATTASKPAGTYRIAFYTDATNSSSGNTTNIEFSVDGVTINAHANGADYYEIAGSNNNDWLPLSAVQYKVLSIAATIDLDVKFANGSGTNARVSNTTIEIWRVS